MPSPVINPTQGVLNPLVGEAYEFQPAASNTPTTWTWTGLPSGFTGDGSTGLVSGMGTKSGRYILTLVAANSSGSSAPCDFFMGIEAAAASSGSDIDVDFDIVSKDVGLRAATALGGASPGADGAAPSTPAAGSAAAAGLVPVCRLKPNEDAVFRVRLKKGGVGQELDVTAFTWTLKQVDDDPVEVTSDAFLLVGSGAEAVYRVHVKLPALAAALADNDADKFTHFEGLSEFKVVYNRDGSFGPSTRTLYSNTFVVEIAAAQS